MTNVFFSSCSVVVICPEDEFSSLVNDDNCNNVYHQNYAISAVSGITSV